MISSISRPHTILALTIILGASLAIAYNRNAGLGHDERVYVAMSEGLSTAGLYAPLYPFLGSLTGLGPLGLKLLSLTSFLVLLTVLNRFDPIAGLIAALCPALFAHGWICLTEMLFTLLFLLTAYLYLGTATYSRAILVGLLTIVCYETRYVGACLVIFMLVVLIRSKKLKPKALAITIGSTGILLGATFNYLWFGFVQGPRPPSQLTLTRILYDLSVGLWGIWIGDTPASNLPLPIVLLSLGILAWLLLKARVWGWLVGSYLALLIFSEWTVHVDPIRRRLLVPIIPILIFFGAKRWIILAAAVCALAMVLRGRVL